MQLDSQNGPKCFPKWSQISFKIQVVFGFVLIPLFILRLGSFLVVFRSAPPSIRLLFTPFSEGWAFLAKSKKVAKMTTQNDAKALPKPLQNHQKDNLKTKLKSNTNSEGEFVQKETPKDSRRGPESDQKRSRFCFSFCSDFQPPVGSAPSEIPL